MAVAEVTDDGFVAIKIGEKSERFDVYEWDKKLRGMIADKRDTFLEDLRELLAAMFGPLSLRGADLFAQQIFKIGEELGKKNIWTPGESAESPWTNAEPADSTDSPSSDSVVLSASP
jgi:hypothetical protein